MSIIRKLVTETDTREHTLVVQLFLILYDKACKEGRHFYLISCTRDSALVDGLKEYSALNKIFKSSSKNKNSLFHWITLSSCDFFEDNSLILCGYMFPEHLERIDDKLYGDAEMYVVEHNKGDCEQWYTKWHNDYLSGNLWSVDFPEVLYRVLAHLTKSINVVCPHSKDDERIKTAIRVINKFVPHASPHKIKDVLISDFGWRLDYANTFAKRLAGLKEGKFFQGGSSTGLKQLFDRWSLEPLPTK